MNHLKKEFKYASNNYKSIEKVMIRGKGIYVYDNKNTAYMDCISGYSALNQGHCDPRLVKTIRKQAGLLSLTSRAYCNDKLGLYSEKLCKTFDYDKVLLMNGGVESGESATKIARAWGYKKKGIPKNEAINVYFNNNFWGRSLAACSSSNDESCYENYGPYLNGVKLLDYNNIEQLEDYLKKTPNVVSVMLEPIQGEGGIIIPEAGYLRKVSRLCRNYNVLMIADEVQTGLGRTGKMLACDYEKVKPDILCLGKALSGGYYPISAILSNKEVMSVLEPGTHGSTYGGNPLACEIGMTALDIIIKDELSENSRKMGIYFREVLKNLKRNGLIETRGKGLLNGLEFESKTYADKFVELMLKEKILTKSTRDNIVRITPPLIINKNQMNILLKTILKVLDKI